MYNWLIIVGLVCGLTQIVHAGWRTVSVDRFDITDIDGSTLSYTYDLLNSYLADRVDQSDLLNSGNRIVADLYDKNIEKGFDSNDSHMRSQRLFQALFEAANNENLRCTSLSSQILHQNDLATRGKARVSSNPETYPLREMVFQLTLKHHNICKGVYPTRYSTISETLDKELLNDLERTIKQVVELISDRELKSTAQDDAQEYFNFAISEHKKQGKNTDYSMLENEGIAKVLYDSVSISAENNPDKKYLQKVASLRNLRPQIDKKRFSSLMNQYLFRPCKLFKQKMSDLFEAANVDSDWKQEAVDVDQPNYYRGWAIYEFCSVLNDDLQMMGNELLKYANQLDYVPK